MLPNALKTCPKSNKAPNLVALFLSPAKLARPSRLEIYVTLFAPTGAEKDFVIFALNGTTEEGAATRTNATA